MHYTFVLSIFSRFLSMCHLRHSYIVKKDFDIRNACNFFYSDLILIHMTFEKNVQEA